ncbi:MAG: hypothetical protein WAV93_11525 [Bacteroidales bacterium]
MPYLIPSPKMQFFTANGIPLVGGKLYTYESGTTTPKSTYVDQLGSAANPNPVIMDSRGEANVWLADTTLYTMVLRDSLDNLIWTVDGVGSFGAGAVPATVSVLDFGAVCDGVTDDTAAIQLALDSVATAVSIPANALVVGDLVVRGTKLIGEGKLVGPGTIVGVIGNEDSPYDVITIWNNLVTADKRTTGTDTAEFVVDPLFGNDTNYGDLANPLKTLQAAVLLASQAIQRNPAADVHVALRSGRVETAPITTAAIAVAANDLAPIFNTTADFFDTCLVILGGSPAVGYRTPPKIVIRSYAGERATICPITTWFFPSVNVISDYDQHSIVSNTTGARFFYLFSGRTGESIPIASTYRKHGMVNQIDFHTTLTVRPAGGWFLGITAANTTYAELAALAIDEIAQSRFRINHWFSSSMHSEDVTFNLSTRLLQGRAYINTVDFTDGWAYKNPGTDGAPYYVENIKTCLDSESFCTSNTGVFLPPTSDGAFFTTAQSTVLLDMSLTSDIMLSDVDIKYHYTDPLSEDAGYRPRFEFAFAVKQGDRNIIDNVAFKYCHLPVQAATYSGYITKSSFYSTNSHAIFNLSTGAHYANVLDCDFKFTGANKLSAESIHFAGKNITIARTIHKYVTGGIHLTSWNVLSANASPGDCFGDIYNNIVTDSGSHSDYRDLKFQRDDTGLYSVYGNGTRVPYQFKYNYGIGSVARTSCGFYGDDACSGLVLYRNVFAGGTDASVSIRNVAVGLLTNDNLVVENLCIGRVDLGSSETGIAATKAYSNKFLGDLAIDANVYQIGNDNSANLKASYDRTHLKILSSCQPVSNFFVKFTNAQKSFVVIQSYI